MRTLPIIRTYVERVEWRKALAYWMVWVGAASAVALWWPA